MRYPDLSKNSKGKTKPGQEPLENQIEEGKKPRKRITKSGLEKLEKEKLRLETWPNAKNELVIYGKIGRPTKYSDEFPQMLIEHMKQGFSYDSFAGVLLVSLSTMYLWEKQHPEFSEAKEIGEVATLQWWEKIAIDNMFNRFGADNLNVMLWSRNMSARFPKRWAPKAKANLEGVIKSDVDKIRAGSLGDAAMAKMAREAAEYLEKQGNQIIDVQAEEPKI